MIRIRKGSPGDLPAVLELLQSSALPVDGVAENFTRFMVALDEGRIVGSAGLEVEGTSALLRSVAIDPASRGAGLGIEIVRQTIRLANVSGVTTVYLLTTSASGFFQKLGFKEILRAEIDAEFPDSVETRPGGLCASAVPMALRDLARSLEPRPRRTG